VFEDPFLIETVPPAVLTRLSDAFTRRPVPPRAQTGAGGDRLRPMREALARLLAADVHVTLGTDSGGLPDHFFGWAEHKELEVLVRMGMTPGQAIVAGTSRPAEHAGLTDLGTVTAGKSADLLVLDANPLDDIRNTQRISAVYLRGQRLDRSRLRAPWAKDK
jgi:imidazolonepropionase-like amidohydrolase